MKKEHSTSFYLSDELLTQLSKASQILNISRSILVNKAIYARFGGYENAQKKYNPKIQKKIPTHKGKHTSHKHKRKKARYEQKCLFDYVHHRLSYIIT